MTLKEFEAGLQEAHRQKERIAAEKKREKEALEADAWGFIVSRRGKRYWKIMRRHI